MGHSPLPCGSTICAPRLCGEGTHHRRAILCGEAPITRHHPSKFTRDPPHMRATTHTSRDTSAPYAYVRHGVVGFVPRASAHISSAKPIPYNMSSSQRLRTPSCLLECYDDGKERMDPYLFFRYRRSQSQAMTKMDFLKIIAMCNSLASDEASEQSKLDATIACRGPSLASGCCPANPSISARWEGRW